VNPLLHCLLPSDETREQLSSNVSGGFWQMACAKSDGLARRSAGGASTSTSATFSGAGGSPAVCSTSLRRAAVNRSLVEVASATSGVGSGGTFSFLRFSRSRRAMARSDWFGSDAGVAVRFSSSFFFLAAASTASFDGLDDPPSSPPLERLNCGIKSPRVFGSISSRRQEIPPKWSAGSIGRRYAGAKIQGASR